MRHSIAPIDGEPLTMDGRAITLEALAGSLLSKMLNMDGTIQKKSIVQY